ncbi:HET domain containing protein [Hyaloscypha variabilis]
MTDEDKNLRLRQELRQSLESIDLSTVECNGSKLNNTNSQLSEVDADIQRLHYLAHTAKSTASDWTIGLAKFWLQSCINGHARCPKPSSHLPSRLLDLTEPSRARVIETHDLREVEYLTLSHCWGGANMLLLESSTANSLFSGVGLSTMPKTFRDAIHVTTRLGYNYLWIDSLCIMQDSAEDWSRESRTMHQIYRHSVCTIAALAAFNGQEGCFIKRNPLQYRDCDLSTITELPLRIQGEYIRRHGDGGLQGSVLRLRKRGWVFQEDLLSPRTLYFGEDGIRWECLEMNRDEAHNPSGECGCGSHHDDPYLFKQDFAILESKFSTIASIWEDYYPSFHSKWWSIVEQYSQLSLTIPSDKLVAINGPIRAIESRGSLTNLAGHWKEHLPLDLLWIAGLGGMRPSKCTRSEEHRAPSWSWASMDGPVEFIWLYRMLEVDEEKKRFKSEFELDAEVLHADVVLLDAGELFNGHEGCGSITLSAQMRKLTWGEGNAVECRWSQRSRIVPKCNWKQDDYRQNLDEVWCVLIIRAQIRFDSTFIEDAGLVLIPHKTSVGCWSRIGVFSQFYKADDGDNPLVFFPRNGTTSAKEAIRIL